MNPKKFDPVRIGVVGLGNFGRLHALTLAGLAEAELVGLVARRPASLEAMGEELPGVPGWLELERAIAESDAEAWVVATSTATHVSVTRMLLAAGKSVLLEKPLAANLAEAETLSPLVRPDSRNLMLGHILLFNSEFRQLQQEIQERGPLVHIDAVRHRPVSTLQRFPGESPLHLLMVHDLYLLLALANRSEPEAFSAQVHRTASGAPDLVVAQLQWPAGPLALLTASFLTPEGMPEDGFDRLEAFGQGWAARVCANPRPLAIWDECARAPLTLEIRADPQAPSGMLAEELRAFCRVVRGQQDVPVGATYQDALQVQHWIERLEAGL